MTTGQRIKAARKKAGMTQKELGDKLGISYVGVSQWENDLRNPKLETLQRIADSLGVPVSILMGYEESYYELKPLDLESLKHSFERSLKNLVNSGIIGTAQTPQDLVLAAMSKLNYEGQQKVVERAEELTEIPRYQAAIAPESTDTTSPPNGPQGSQDDQK